MLETGNVSTTEFEEVLRIMGNHDPKVPTHSPLSSWGVEEGDRQLRANSDLFSSMHGYGLAPAASAG